MDIEFDKLIAIYNDKRITYLFEEQNEIDTFKKNIISLSNDFIKEHKLEKEDFIKLVKNDLNLFIANHYNEDEDSLKDLNSNLNIYWIVAIQSLITLNAFVINNENGIFTK